MLGSGGSHKPTSSQMQVRSTLSTAFDFCYSPVDALAAAEAEYGLKVARTMLSLFGGVGQAMVAVA